MTDPLEALFTLHSDLPRQGPGSDDDTRAALRALGEVRSGEGRPRILDLGCGPGAQTLVLAKELGGQVVALDFHEPYLTQLRTRAEAAGLDARIETRCGDFAQPIEGAPFDLLWSEGAAYILGFENALTAWRKLVQPGGLAVVSECTWWTDAPSEEIGAFWNAAYPVMGTIDSNRAAAERGGWEVLGTRRLPSDAWWPEYYTPLRARIESLRERAASDAALAAVLAESEQEMALFEAYSDEYGYAFYLLRAR